jgi:hypothetical protein
LSLALRPCLSRARARGHGSRLRTLALEHACPGRFCACPGDRRKPDPVAAPLSSLPCDDVEHRGRYEQ